MTQSEYFKNHCSACGGGVEFPPNGVGDEISCPHCHGLMLLDFPKNEGIDPTRQIDAFLGTGYFPKTRAQLSFLKMFIFPLQISDIRGQEVWQQALTELPETIAGRFIASGLLKEGNSDVVILLQSKSRVELKSMAKIRGLGQSGTTEDFAKRLFKADPNGMSAFFRGKDFLTCTAKGRLIVTRFEESENHLKATAEASSFTALKTGHYKEAFEIVAAYEATKVFQRGIGEAHLLDILSGIGTLQLGRHRSIPESLLPYLRACAGMMCLWGENSPRRWITEQEQEFANEPALILFAAYAIIRLRGMKQAGITKVNIIGSGLDNLCPVCSDAEGKTYHIESAPGLPHEGCTCDSGCHCILGAVG